MDQSIPTLPPVPLLERPLESPWIIVALLAMVGLGIFWVLNSRGKAVRGLVFAGVFLGAGALLGVGSLLVVTPREVMRARSAALTHAVAEGDVATVRSLVHPSAKLYFFRARDGWGFDRVIDFVETDMRGQYAVREVSIGEIEAALDGPEVGRTQVHAKVTPESTGVPLGVIVRLDWQRIDGQWRVVRIEPLWVAGAGDVSGR